MTAPDGRNTAPILVIEQDCPDDCWCRGRCLPRLVPVEAVLQIHKPDGSLTVALGPNGEVVFGDAVTVTDAAHQFWDAVTEAIRQTAP